jgi:hypothetical protein
MAMSSEPWYFTRNPDLDSMLERVHQQSLWRELNPELTITANPFGGVSDGYSLDPADLQQALTQVREEGYLHSSPAIPTGLCQSMARAVSNIIAAGYHPIFLSLYDEYWQIMKRTTAALEPVLGPGCYPLADYWVWSISLETSGSGWTPHRDLQFRDRPTLRENGLPLLVTAWLPFTDTGPLNGCMYVMPTNRDANLPDHPESFGFSNLQDVRALPAQAGSILAWNQQILHWGSAASKWAKNPRISTGVYFQSADVEPFGPRPIDFRAELPFQQRLAYLAANLLAYHQWHCYPEPVLDMAVRCLLADPTYLDLLPAALKAAVQARLERQAVANAS